MSESNAHRMLVMATTHAMRKRYPNMLVRADIQESPGDPVPPLIGGYRPDLIGRCVRTRAHVLIAEAKTDRNIDKQHTRDQIGAFLDHLYTLPRGVGTFVLAVDGRVADRARTFLRFACGQYLSSRLCVNLFDGLDFWILGPRGAPPWRLC